MAEGPLLPSMLLAACIAATPAIAADTTPAAQLERFASQAGRPGVAARGAAFFGARHGGAWSCASCHTDPATSPGRHAATGKVIAPLAPSANPAALTDTARVDRWLRRNCREVLERDCTPGEKADVVAWLLSLPR